MMTTKETPAPLNVQYSQIGKQGTEIELLVNGHIDDEYYEGTVLVHPAILENKVELQRVLNTCLLKVKEKAEKLRRDTN